MNIARRYLQRRVYPLWGLVVTASSVAFYAMTATVAVGQEDCHLPDMISTIGDSAFIDHGEEGATVGDRRVLTHILSDSDGQQVGIVHAMSTVLHSPGADATTIHVDGTITFDTGTLHWSSVQTLADPSDTSRSTNDAVEAVVQGGTGAFRHARGVILLAPTGDGTFDVSFEISCDY